MQPDRRQGFSWKTDEMIENMLLERPETMWEDTQNRPTGYTCDKESRQAFAGLHRFESIMRLKAFIQSALVL